MLHLLTEISKGATFDEISTQDKLSSKASSGLFGPFLQFCEWSLFYDTFLKLTVLECPIYVLAIGSPQSKLCYKVIKIHKLCIWI